MLGQSKLLEDPLHGWIVSWMPEDHRTRLWSENVALKRHLQTI
jgi:hypothetical protein